MGTSCIPWSCISNLLPASTLLLLTSPIKPLPGISFSEFTGLSVVFICRIMACPIGWLVLDSSEAANFSHPGTALGIVFTFSTANIPLVKVPVLSNTTVLIVVIRSKKLEPLNKIPFLDAAPIPPKYPKGIEITSAQGQEITKNTKALYNHSLKE